MNTQPDDKIDIRTNAGLKRAIELQEKRGVTALQIMNTDYWEFLDAEIASILQGNKRVSHVRITPIVAPLHIEFYKIGLKIRIQDRNNDVRYIVVNNNGVTITLCSICKEPCSIQYTTPDALFKSDSAYFDESSNTWKFCNQLIS